MYIWNLITSLVPRKYHRAIGGFDETMRDAWEDWDYWLRMSHMGYCFTYLTQPLVEYRFSTGTRRAAANPEESGESGRQLGVSLIEYLQSKYEGTQKMACGGCSKHRATPVQRPVVPLASSLNEGSVMDTNASELVWVMLDDGNVGSHPISFSGVNYGYRSSGERFKMYREHAELDRRVRIVEPDLLPKTLEEEEPEELAPPVEDFAEWTDEDNVGGGEVELEEEFDPFGTYVEFTDEEPENEPDLLVLIWGIDEERSKILHGQDIHTPEDVISTGADGMIDILGVSQVVAKRIISSAKAGAKQPG